MVLINIRTLKRKWMSPFRSKIIESLQSFRQIFTISPMNNITNFIFLGTIDKKQKPNY